MPVQYTEAAPVSPERPLKTPDQSDINNLPVHIPTYSPNPVFTPERDSPSPTTFSPSRQSLYETSPEPLLQSELQQVYYTEADILRAMKRTISYEQRLEDAKTKLAQRSDFNLYDVYDMFDDIGKGYLNT
jgi:hypothetical protein